MWISLAGMRYTTSSNKCLTCWRCGRTFWMEEAGGCASPRPQPVALLILPGTNEVMTFRCSRCCGIERLASANAAGLRVEEC